MGMLTQIVFSSTVVKSKEEVAAYFKSKHILPFGFAEQSGVYVAFPTL